VKRRTSGAAPRHGGLRGESGEKWHVHAPMGVGSWELENHQVFASGQFLVRGERAEAGRGGAGGWCWGRKADGGR
jgi:hypothetical protein